MLGIIGQDAIFGYDDSRARWDAWLTAMLVLSGFLTIGLRPVGLDFFLWRVAFGDDGNKVAILRIEQIGFIGIRRSTARVVMPISGPRLHWWASLARQKIACVLRNSTPGTRIKFTAIRYRKEDGSNNSNDDSQEKSSSPIAYHAIYRIIIIKGMPFVIHIHNPCVTFQ